MKLLIYTTLSMMIAIPVALMMLAWTNNNIWLTGIAAFACVIGVVLDKTAEDY